MKQPKYLDLRGFLSFLIMHEISKKPKCGDELAEIIGKRKGTKLTPGTIYPALKKLREQKLVRLKQSGRKKNYYLTKKGKTELKLVYSLFSRTFKGLKGKIR